MTSWQRRMAYHCLGWMTCWRHWVRISGFSCLDLVSGSVKDDDRPQTAFSAQQGQFHWRVMPFRLTNGPASFTRLMNLVLNGLTWTCCLLYLNDIIICASTFEDHIRRLRLLFDRVRTTDLNWSLLNVTSFEAKLLFSDVSCLLTEWRLILRKLKPSKHGQYH